MKNSKGEVFTIEQAIDSIRCGYKMGAQEVDIEVALGLCEALTQALNSLKAHRAPARPEIVTQSQIREMLRWLRQLASDATMERSRFDCMHGTPPDNPLPMTEDGVTPFIRRRTSLWRDTWIILPINNVIDILERAREQ